VFLLSGRVLAMRVMYATIVWSSYRRPSRLLTQAARQDRQDRRVRATYWVAGRVPTMVVLADRVAGVARRVGRSVDQVRSDPERRN
jgi:hypothetical protein